MSTVPRRRNPDWTEEELIVALDAFFSLRESGRLRSAADPGTIHASRVLNQLRIHPAEKRTPKFRDPAGVGRRFNYFGKLEAHQRIDGRTAYVAVWERYKDDREGLRQAAQEIESGIYSAAEELRSRDHDNLEADLNALRDDQSLNETERQALIKARQGQGAYRSALIRLWRKCAATGCEEQSLLIASHLKPWSKSSNKERLDPYNGLLLSPTWDRLFDRGLASLADDGTVLVSSYLSTDDRKRLGICDRLRIALEDSHLLYVRHHRRFEFKT